MSEIDSPCHALLEAAERLLEGTLNEALRIMENLKFLQREQYWTRSDRIKAKLRIDGLGIGERRVG